MVQYSPKDGAEIVSDYFAVGRTDLYGETYASQAAQDAVDLGRVAKAHNFIKMASLCGESPEVVDQLLSLIEYADAKLGDEHTEIAAHAADAVLKIHDRHFVGFSSVEQKIEQSSLRQIKNPRAKYETKDVSALLLSRVAPKQLESHIGYVLSSVGGKSPLSTKTITQMAEEKNFKFEEVASKLARSFPEDSIRLKRAVEQAYDNAPLHKKDVLGQAMSDISKGQRQGINMRRATQRRPGISM